MREKSYSSLTSGLVVGEREEGAVALVLSCCQDENPVLYSFGCDSLATALLRSLYCYDLGHVGLHDPVFSKSPDQLLREIISFNSNSVPKEDHSCHSKTKYFLYCGIQ